MSVILIGVDPSLSACGVVGLSIEPTAIKTIYRNIIETSPDDPLALRLRQLMKGCHEVAKLFRHEMVYAAVESPPQGAKMHNSALLAQTAGACLMGLYPIETHMYTAAAVKRFLVPHWYGYSKNNWARAGLKKRFKRSNPSKTAVSSHLATKYGIYIADPDIADATATAIYMGHKHGLIKGTYGKEANRIQN